MAASLTVNELLDGHVALDIECLDRVYLNGYVPSLQVGGQVVSFMTAHLGYPAPSPAIMEKMGTAFRRAVRGFAETNRIPVVRFHNGDGKIDVMGRYLAVQAATGQDRRHGPLPGRAGGYRSLGRGGDRCGPGVPERVRGDAA